MNILKQFFTEKRSSPNTRKHYLSSVKIYEELNNLTLDTLLEEADSQEEEGIRWKHRKIRDRLISYRSYLYATKSEGTAKLYLNDIRAIYRHYLIELHPLPSFDSKQIDKTYEMSYQDLLTKSELIDAYYEANNIVKCIILFVTSTGLSKVDLLNLTVGDFLKACDCKTDDIENELLELKNQKELIPCFTGNRQKTNKPYITFCSPEAAEHIIQYLIGRNAQLKSDRGSCLDCDMVLFDISLSHLNYTFRKINDKLGLGTVGKTTKFRCHMLRKWHASTLLNIEEVQWSVEEIDTLQGRSQDKTHRAYFMNSVDKLFKKYYDCVDELMLFTSIHEVDKEAYEKLEKENKVYIEEIAKSNEKLENQQRTIDEIISNQRELENLLRVQE